MKIFVDTNVLLDTIVPRQNRQFTVDSGLFLSLRDTKDYELCVSTLSLATCAFYLRDKEGVHRRMKLLTDRMTILDTRASDFQSAMASGENDVEDAMQFSVAASNNCDLIVTRDKLGFRKSPVPFMTPDEVLNRLQIEQY